MCNWAYLNRPQEIFLKQDGFGEYVWIYWWWEIELYKQQAQFMQISIEATPNELFIYQK